MGEDGCAHRVARRADRVAQVHERVAVTVREDAGHVDVMARGLALRIMCHLCLDEGIQL